ncbi:hypothetical protein TYRP_016063 [Tyrophagus putrescentiae]|nr:hypothetical protein TYRP_016063 [Tyrophagus putrescentiae]
MSSLTVMNPVDRSNRNDSVSSWFNQVPRNFGLFDLTSFNFIHSFIHSFTHRPALTLTMSLITSTSTAYHMRPPRPTSTSPSTTVVTVGNGENGLLGRVFLAGSYLAVAATFPLSLLLCFKVVQEYERAVIFRLGKLVGGGAKGPGLFFILPCIDDYSVVDLRTITFDVPPQEVLTKDSVTVAVDAVVYYRIWLPTIAVANVYDYGNATRLLTSTTLRNVLGTKTLTEILSERENISLAVRAILDEVTKVWGVKVERVEIKDVRLPVNFQRSMAVEAEAVREARAKIIASEGEKKASYALMEASEILSTERMALQLRFMQNLGSNTEGKETTILFPVPMPMMTIGLNSVTHNGEDLRSVKSMDDGGGYGDGGDGSISPKHRSGSFSSVVGDGGADGGFAEDENDDDQ